MGSSPNTITMITHLLLAALLHQRDVIAHCPNSHLSCQSTTGETCNPCHTYAKMLHADPCFPSGGKFRCLGATGSFQTMECDCSVSDCGCSTGPSLTSCSSTVPPANMMQYIRDVRTYCRMDRRHTLCKYKDGSRGRCGANVCARGFTDEAEKNRMVDKHNEFRRELAEGEVTESDIPGEGEPPAANMEEVVWDDEIARIAQRWADQCHGLNNQPHDEVRSVQGYPHHGFCCQNIFSKSSSHPWAKTTAIGCGYVVWQDSDSQEYPPGLDYHQIVVCNYCPGGNAAGEPIYEIGETASNCPEGEVDNEGLCSQG